MGAGLCTEVRFTVEAVTFIVIGRKEEDEMLGLIVRCQNWHRVKRVNRDINCLLGICCSTLLCVLLSQDELCLSTFHSPCDLFTISSRL